MKAAGDNQSKTNSVRKIKDPREAWGPVAKWEEERGEGVCALRIAAAVPELGTG